MKSVIRKEELGIDERDREREEEREGIERVHEPLEKRCASKVAEMRIKTRLQA